MYIDDILLIVQSPEILKQYTLTTLGLLEALGHLVNYPKSQLTHTQSTTFLWLVVNCKTVELNLPSSQVQDYLEGSIAPPHTSSDYINWHNSMESCQQQSTQPHCTTGDKMEWTYKVVINTTQGQPVLQQLPPFRSNSKTYRGVLGCLRSCGSG